jgi:hypothetical protein
MSAETPVFFEKVRDQDCAIHSLNNAMGRKIIEKKEVVAFIDEMVERFRRDLRMDISRADEMQYRHRFSEKCSSFFTAEIVWKAAQEAGRIGPQIPIPGFGGKFSAVANLPVPLPPRMVVLGIEPTTRTQHAIAVRDGKIYDSLRDEPAPLTDAELRESLSEVFAAYVVTETSEEAKHFSHVGPAYVFTL